MLLWFSLAMNTDIVSELSAHFPPETVITQNEDLISYSYDGTPILKQLPKVVVLVSSREDVSTELYAGGEVSHAGGHQGFVDWIERR